MKFFVSLFAMLAVVQLQAQTLTTHNCYVRDPNASPREHNIDMERQKLEVEFEPAKGLVKGKVTHSFTCFLMGMQSLLVPSTL